MYSTFRVLQSCRKTWLFKRTHLFVTYWKSLVFNKVSVHRCLQNMRLVDFHLLSTCNKNI